MLKLMSAEYQKLKRTFTKNLIWIAPMATMLLCAGLSSGYGFQNGSYNWWYTMMLPGMLTLICASVIEKIKEVTLPRYPLPSGKFSKDLVRENRYLCFLVSRFLPYFLCR